MDFKDCFQDKMIYHQQLAQAYVIDFSYLKSLFFNIDTDSYIIKLLESFIPLSAKVRQKLDDMFLEISHNLLERLFPLLLWPLPASIILKLSMLLREKIHFKKSAQRMV